MNVSANNINNGVNDYITSNSNKRNVLVENKILKDNNSNNKPTKLF